MSRHRITRDGRGQFALAITVNAAVFGGLGVLGMALTPLPTTLIRDLTSPPAAVAPVPTRPLDVLPGMGSRLELVRWPRVLDTAAVKTPIHERSASVHERKGGARSEGGSAGHHFNGGDGHAGSQSRVHRGRHASDPWTVHRGRHEDAGRSPRLHHPVHGVRHDGDHVDGHHDSAGRHHRADGNVGEHHQGAHSQGGHHAEHEGGRHRG